MFHRLKTWLRVQGDNRPRLPNGTRIYAIGDVHGRFDLLDPLLKRISEDYGRQAVMNAFTVFLGDYVDRGPASGDVLSRLIDFSRAHPTICLKGNHEVYLMRFLGDPNVLDEWARLGALPTLTSYGLTPSLKPKAAECAQLSDALNAAMPAAHKSFLANLPISFSCGDFFFTHAGVRPGIPLTRQKEGDLLYIREEFLGHDGAFEKFVVHGHTPVKEPDQRFNRINIDTGAYATGRLTCLCLDGDDMRFI